MNSWTPFSGPWLEDKSVPDEEQQKIAEILSLVGGRSEFLDLVRRYGINRLVPHVFPSGVVVYFLRHYICETSDCPSRVGDPDLAGRVLKSATLKRGELLAVYDHPEIEHKLRVHWEFERNDGMKKPYAVDLEVHKNIS